MVLADAQGIDKASQVLARFLLCNILLLHRIDGKLLVLLLLVLLVLVLLLLDYGLVGTIAASSNSSSRFRGGSGTPYGAEYPTTPPVLAAKQLPHPRQRCRRSPQYQTPDPPELELFGLAPVAMGGNVPAGEAKLPVVLTCHTAIGQHHGNSRVFSLASGLPGSVSNWTAH